MTEATFDERRVLILAPRGRDAAVIAQVLARLEVSTEAVVDFAALLASLDEAAGAVILTEEAIAEASAEDLFAWLARQPPWADLPVILLSTKRVGKRPERAAAAVEQLGNVVLLERPVNAETLIGAANAALRARRRQYEARAYLLEREDAQRQLRLANETLERRVEDRTVEVEAARETLAFALESAGMGSWDLDLRRETSRRSARHDLIFGYDRPLETWGRTEFFAHVEDDDRALAEQAFASALGGGTLDLECRIRRRDGSIGWVSIKGRVDYDRGGLPIRMAGIVIDRTDQRGIEDALRQAQKMEAIGQITGGVAHDFNNLLTVIVGGLDLIIRRPEPAARVKRLAEAGMTAARRGEQLTQQLLAFSRRQMLRPRTLNPNKLLIEFKPLAERAAGGDIALLFDLDPGIDPIRVDAAQFESAVLNLIVNARDAMASGRDRTIRVRSRNVALDAATVKDRGVPAGAYVEISVTDSGSGIDPQVLARVFEPFFTTKDVGKGTGLGLSQIYGFTRSARGFAAIESVVGSGTTVRLLFPQSVDPADEDTIKSSGSAVPLRRALDGETVLLVEDDEQVLAMAIESLEELRYTLVIARNAAEALDHLKEDGQRIDLLFSDVMMPGGMNGSQLAVEARRIRPGIKILLTSGYVANLDDGQVIGEGETAVLNKPYRRDELARSLRIVLGDAASSMSEDVGGRQDTSGRRQPT